MNTWHAKFYGSTDSSSSKFIGMYAVWFDKLFCFAFHHSHVIERMLPVYLRHHLSKIRLWGEQIKCSKNLLNWYLYNMNVSSLNMKDYSMRLIFYFFSKFTYLFPSGLKCILVRMFAMLRKCLREKECYKLKWLLILLNLFPFYWHLLRRFVLPYDGLVWQLTWHPSTWNKKLGLDTKFCFASFWKEKRSLY